MFVRDEVLSLYYFSTIYSLLFSTNKKISALEINIFYLKIYFKLNIHLINIQYIFI